MIRFPSPVIPCAVACFALIACEAKHDPQQPMPTSTLADGYWIGTAPGDARAVAAVVKDSQDGDEIAVIGKVGGAPEVFVADRALFRLVDLARKDCTNDGTGCATPWDYCCEDPAAMRSGSLTVEFRDAGGALLATTARGFHGLEHGKTAIVKGRVLRDATGNVVLVASAIHVQS